MGRKHDYTFIYETHSDGDGLVQYSKAAFECKVCGGYSSQPQPDIDFGTMTMLVEIENPRGCLGYKG